MSAVVDVLGGKQIPVIGNDNAIVLVIRITRSKACEERSSRCREMAEDRGPSRRSSQGRCFGAMETLLLFVVRAIVCN